MNFFYPLLESTQVCQFTLGKPAEIKIEFLSPKYNIQSTKIKNGGITLVTALLDKCKNTISFCKKYNRNQESYYIQEIYLMKGEEPIFGQNIVRGVRQIKFLIYFFEEDDGHLID